MSKEIAKRDSNLPANVADLFEAAAGAGTEEVGAEDISLPFLKQVQDISDERDKHSPEYIDGADSGDFFNSVTRELYKGDLEIIPCSIRKTAVAFKPRDEGGGFLGEFEDEEQALEYLSDPAEIVDTVTLAVYYRLMGTDGPFMPALLTFNKSKLKPARALTTQLVSLRVEVNGKSIQPPIYGTRFALASVRAKSAKGSYFNIAFRFVGLVTDADLLAEAGKFGTMMSERTLRTGFDEEVFGEKVDTEDTPF